MPMLIVAGLVAGTMNAAAGGRVTHLDANRIDVARRYLIASRTRIGYRQQLVLCHISDTSKNMPSIDEAKSILKKYKLRGYLSPIENAILITSSRQLDATSVLYPRSGRRQYLAFTKSAALWGYFAVCAAQATPDVEKIASGVTQIYKKSLAQSKLGNDKLDISSTGIEFYVDSLRCFSGIPNHRLMNNTEILQEAEISVFNALLSLEKKNL